MTAEEAVVLMYRYGRFARPKPRPKRSRKPAMSTMGVRAFIAAVEARRAEVGGQLFVSKGRQSDVFLTHYNVPKNTKDEARRQSNRLMVSVDGWERGGAPPKDGTVKLEVLVSARLKDARGRTSTPEAMVDVVVEMFQRHSALKSV